ncbi:MAG: hypothetical protein U0T82_06515 [Bacteroidales bacterium]
MKYKLILLFVLPFTSLVSGYSQPFSLYVETGIGTYNMKNMRDLNSQILKDLPFEARAVYNFQPWFYYKLSGLFTHSLEWQSGPGLEIIAAGSRISRKDYSGEYRFDLKAYSFSPYYEVKRKVPLSDGWYGDLGALVGARMSNLFINEYFKLGTENDEDSQDLVSLNFFAGPSASFGKRIKSIILELNIGYEIDFLKSGLMEQGNVENITFRHGKQLDWSGFRFGLALGYSKE